MSRSAVACPVCGATLGTTRRPQRDTPPLLRLERGISAMTVVHGVVYVRCSCGACILWRGGVVIQPEFGRIEARGGYR